MPIFMALVFKKIIKFQNLSFSFVNSEEKINLIACKPFCVILTKCLKLEFFKSFSTKN